jgi:hypothetical protein
MVVYNVLWVFKSLAVSTGTAGLMGNANSIFMGSYINWVPKMTYSVETLSAFYFLDVGSAH